MLAVAANRPRNDPAVVPEPRGCQSVHAEVRALARVADPRGATVYVARVAADGTVALSEPCFECRATLEAAGVRRVVWTG